MCLTIIKKEQTRENFERPKNLHRKVLVKELIKYAERIASKSEKYYNIKLKSKSYKACFPPELVLLRGKILKYRQKVPKKKRRSNKISFGAILQCKSKKGSYQCNVQPEDDCMPKMDVTPSIIEKVRMKGQFKRPKNLQRLILLRELTKQADMLASKSEKYYNYKLKSKRYKFYLSPELVLLRRNVLDYRKNKKQMKKQRKARKRTTV